VAKTGIDRKRERENRNVNLLTRDTRIISSKVELRIESMELRMVLYEISKLNKRER
jgi:hypothetical protein